MPAQNLRRRDVRQEPRSSGARLSRGLARRRGRLVAGPPTAAEEPHHRDDHREPENRPDHPPTVVAVFGQQHLHHPLSAAVAGTGAGAASPSSFGSTRSSHPGIHQFARPMSCITAGTSTIRTTVASTRIAVAIPTPISLRKTSVLKTKARKTTTLIAAAAVITRAVFARPSETALCVSPVRWYSSRIRERRNTS